MSIDYKEILFKKSFELTFPEIDGKQSSEISVELKCHIENIISVLRKAVEKFKISLILPKLLENPKVLQQSLQHTKYNRCVDLLQEYRKRSKSQPHSNPNESDILQIIDYFQDHYTILNVLPNWMDDRDTTETYFLEALKDVCRIAEERFQRSAIKELAYEKRLHAFYLANEETVNSLKKIKQKIQQRKISERWKHVAKNVVIQKLEEELAFNQNDNQLFIKREMYKSQGEIQRINNAFVAKQQELEEDLKKARFNYEAKLKMDLMQEKSVQDERKKIELQLQALIKKYDQTIYDKHVEEILLQEECNKQKQDFQEFLKVYKKEEEIYEELVVKQQQLEEAKALIFSFTQAAIKIQKWWKAIQKRKAKKKKRSKAAKKRKVP